MKRYWSILLLIILLTCTGCVRSAGVAGTVGQTVPATTAESTAEPTTETTAETSAAEPTVYIEFSREGEVSSIPVQIVSGTVGSYTIATDPEYFTFYAQETVDLFSYDAWEGEMSVFYCVSNYNGEDPQQFIEDVLLQFEKQYEYCDTEQTTLGSYEATAVYFSSCKDAPEYQKHIFLIDCGEDRYLIEAQFTFEMYEGLYAEMLALFDTFTAT